MVHRACVRSPGPRPLEVLGSVLLVCVVLEVGPRVLRLLARYRVAGGGPNARAGGWKISWSAC